MTLTIQEIQECQLAPEHIEMTTEIQALDSKASETRTEIEIAKSDNQNDNSLDRMFSQLSSDLVQDLWFIG